SSPAGSSTPSASRSTGTPRASASRRSTGRPGMRRVGAERVASSVRLSTPPLRTRRATFAAPGSPEISIPHQDYSRVVIPFDFAEIAATIPLLLAPVAVVHWPRRLLSPGIVDLLPPFALWSAFPASDYYGGSDAPEVSLPDCWGHLFHGSLP